MFSWMADLAAVVMWFWLVVRLVRGVEKKMNAWAESMPGTWRSLLVELSGGVLRVSAPLFAAILMLPLLQLPATIEMVAQKVIAITLILGVAGLIIRAVSVFQRVVLAQNRMDIADNLQARKISTQVRVVGRIIIWVVSILALGSTLMVFDSVRQLGTSILASAGIAGIILGLAAQRTLGNLIAGIQIAISQPIRFDDVLVVEGQFGRVEEINLTYVCLKLWDLRRMIVPITYFVERPFENWTRTGSKVLGAAMIYTDYHVPVEALRSELRRIVETCREWDRDVCGLQVTDCRESCVEIRCLVSAANASDAFDLRCIIRERMLAFVSENYPAALPRTRATLDQFPCPDVTASEVSDPDSGDSRRS
jgi:small-conductance mechanosensitive channel